MDWQPGSFNNKYFGYMSVLYMLLCVNNNNKYYCYNFVINVKLLTLQT